MFLAVLHRMDVKVLSSSLASIGFQTHCQLLAYNHLLKNWQSMVACLVIHQNTKICNYKSLIPIFVPAESGFSVPFF